MVVIFIAMISGIFFLVVMRQRTKGKLFEGIEGRCGLVVKVKGKPPVPQNQNALDGAHQPWQAIHLGDRNLSLQTQVDDA
jgi:hypothetical protein